MHKEAPGTAKRILVVDDEADIRSILNALLTRYGYIVTEARDGQEALDLIEQYNSGGQ